MILEWIGDAILLLVVLPIVVYLLRGVYDATRSIVPSAARIATAAQRGSADLDAASAEAGRATAPPIGPLPSGPAAAIQTRTGELVWKTNRGGELDVSNSSGPIVANGVVVAGSTCQYSSHGCYVTGHDAKTGRELWRNQMIPHPGEPGDDAVGPQPYWGTPPRRRAAGGCPHPLAGDGEGEWVPRVAGENRAIRQRG